MAFPVAEPFAYGDYLQLIPMSLMVQEAPSMSSSCVARPPFQGYFRLFRHVIFTSNWERGQDIWIDAKWTAVMYYAIEFECEVDMCHDPSGCYRFPAFQPYGAHGFGCALGR